MRNKTLEELRRLEAELRNAQETIMYQIDQIEKDNTAAIDDELMFCQRLRSDMYDSITVAKDFLASEHAGHTSLAMIKSIETALDDVNTAEAHPQVHLYAYGQVDTMPAKRAVAELALLRHNDDPKLGSQHHSNPTDSQYSHEVRERVRNGVVAATPESDQEVARRQQEQHQRGRLEQALQADKLREMGMVPSPGQRGSLSRASPARGSPAGSPAGRTPMPTSPMPSAPWRSQPPQGGAASPLPRPALDARER